MKKSVFSYIFVITAFILFSGVFATASGDWFVNDNATVLPKFFEGVYAIGKNGTELLSRENVFALSSSGLQPLGAANYSGGGGLLYDDGAISIRDDRVKVGLAYYYSASRDSSVDSAALENATGGGFAIGYLDESGDFSEQASTQYDKIVVMPALGNSVDVYAGNELVYTASATGRANYLVVRPMTIACDAVTNFLKNSYYGDFCFAVLGNGKLTVVNDVDMEHYVMGVCACEMSESWPLEALKAQAVAARTFVQKMISNSVYYYTCGFDVTADTYCQVYQGFTKVGKQIEAAVIATENQYLTYNGALIDALYSAADGGATESSTNVFGNNAHPYLTGIFDPYEAAAGHPYTAWSVTMTPKQLGNKVGIGPVKAVEVTTSETGNVIKLDLTSASGQIATIIRDSCRTVLGLKNIRYKISKDSADNFVFTGSGYGHNLGMSQWGAYAMAKHFEKDYKAILGFYYTKVGLSFGVKE